MLMIYTLSNSISSVFPKFRFLLFFDFGCVTCFIVHFCLICLDICQSNQLIELADNIFDWLLIWPNYHP